MADEKLKVAGIKLRIDGSAEFSKNLKNTNSNLKTAQSELQKTQAEYQEQGKTVEALSAKQKALQKVLDEQRSKTRQLNDILAETTAEYGENSSQVAAVRSQVAQSEAAEAKLEAQLRTTNKELAEQTNHWLQLGQMMDSAGEKITAYGDKATKVGQGLTAGVTVPVVAIGAAAVTSFQEVDEGYDIIATKTGALGEDLESLQSTAKKVFTSMPADMSDVGSALGEINTRLEFTDDTLEVATGDFLKFARVNDVDVTNAISKVARYMGDAKVESSEYKKVLDNLTLAGQKTGIAVDTLAENLTKYGAPLRALGFETEESIALVSQWEKAGVNVEIAFSGMKKAISNWASEGKDSREEFKKTLDEIEKAPDIAAATTKAIEIFGAKAGPDLADAIKGGRFAYEDLLNVLENSQGTLEKTYDTILDGDDQAKISLNEAKVALSELGEELLTGAVPALQDLGELAAKAGDWFAKLSPKTQENIVKVGAFAAVTGPAVSILGKLTSGIGSAVSVGGKFTKWLASHKKQTEDTTKAMNNLSNTMSAGKFGAAAGIAAVAISGIVLTVNHVKKELDDLAADMNVFPEKITSFISGIDTAKGVLSGFNVEQLITSERLSEIDSGIENAQQRIIQIAQNAASKSREITDREYAEIEKLIGMIDSYTAEKLDAYNQQQKIVSSMAATETDMSYENVQNYLKSAQEAYEQTVAEIEQLRANYHAKGIEKLDKAIAKEEKKRKEGKISEEEFLNIKAELEKSHNDDMKEYESNVLSKRRDEAQDYYADTLTIINNAFYEQSVAQDEGIQKYIEYVSKYDEASHQLKEVYLRNADGMKWASAEDKRLESELVAAKEENQKKIIKLLNGTAGDTLAAWVSIAGTTEMYGGTVSEKSKVIVDTIEQNYNTLPKKVKKSFSDAMLGALNALEEKSPALFKKTWDIGTGVVSRLMKVFDEHSPSRVTRKIFGFLLEGGELGLDDEKGNLFSKVDDVSQEVIDRMTFNPNAFPKARSIGSLASLSGTAEQVLSSYSNSYSSSYDYHTETHDSGIHIGRIDVHSDNGSGSLESQLERIEYKRRQAERMKGKR